LGKLESNSMEKSAKIYIAGHNGMVGSAIKRKLEASGFNNLVYRSSKELDLRNQQAVSDFLQLSARIMCFWLLQKWVVLWPITLIVRILFMRI